MAANCNVEVVEDLTLAKNECLIETDSGIYDCGLGTQLEEVKKKLMLLAFQRERRIECTYRWWISESTIK